MGGLAPGAWDQESDNDVVNDGTSSRQPSTRPGHIQTGATGSKDPAEIEGRRAVRRILDVVDAQPELKGAGFVLQFPNADGFLLRKPDHPSGLATYVVAKVEIPSPVEQRTFWQRWNGVILNCGGAVVSWTGVAASALAEVPTVGASTPLTVVAVIGATATSAQCGLAIAKETSPGFEEYVQGPNGDWINVLDIALDVTSLVGGIAGAVQAVKGGSALLQTSKYASELDKLPKGSLLKTLEKLKKTSEDLGYFEEALTKLIAANKVADPALRKVSGNLLKRALPLITASLRKEVYANLTNVIGEAMSTVSSGYGGVGSKNLGLVKITIQLFQENILDTP